MIELNNTRCYNKIHRRIPSLIVFPRFRSIRLIFFFGRRRLKDKEGETRYSQAIFRPRQIYQTLVRLIFREWKSSKLRKFELYYRRLFASLSLSLKSRNVLPSVRNKERCIYMFKDLYKLFILTYLYNKILLHRLIVCERVEIEIIYIYILIIARIK